MTMTNKDRKNGKSKNRGEKGIRITMVAFQTFIQPQLMNPTKPLSCVLLCVNERKGLCLILGFPRSRA